VTPIYLEVGPKRVFACSIEWPGWCRSGKGEEAAIEALLDYADRYAAAIPGFAADLDVDVVERVTGNSTTDFGAPDVPLARDDEPLGADAGRFAAILRSSYAAFDAAVVGAPEVLPKGPRGGGRDRGGIADHVREANRSWAKKLGVGHPPGTPLADTLAAVAAAVEGGVVATGRWPTRYAVRRIAWHLLDHAWELEDKS
jgi:hypothetical protein